MDRAVPDRGQDRDMEHAVVPNDISDRGVVEADTDPMDDRRRDLSPGHGDLAEDPGHGLGFHSVLRDLAGWE